MLRVLCLSTILLFCASSATRAEDGNGKETQNPEVSAEAPDTAARGLTITPQPPAEGETILPPRIAPAPDERPEIPGEPLRGPYEGPSGGQPRDLFQRLPEDAGEVQPLQTQAVAGHDDGVIPPGEREESTSE